MLTGRDGFWAVESQNETFECFFFFAYVSRPSSPRVTRSDRDNGRRSSDSHSSRRQDTIREQVWPETGDPVSSFASVSVLRRGSLWRALCTVLSAFFLPLFEPPEHLNKILEEILQVSVCALFIFLFFLINWAMLCCNRIGSFPYIHIQKHVHICMYVYI